MPRCRSSRAGCQLQSQPKRSAFLLQPLLPMSAVSSSARRPHDHPPPSAEDTNLGAGLHIYFSSLCQTRVTWAGDKGHLRLLRGFHLPHQDAPNIFGNVAFNLPAPQSFLLFSLPLSCPVWSSRPLPISSLELCAHGATGPPLPFRSHRNTNKKNKLPHYLSTYVLFYSLFPA